MRNENRGTNKNRVDADQLRQGIDTDSSNEDSRGSSTGTLSAILDGIFGQESTSSDGQSTVIADGDKGEQVILENI